MAKKDIDMENYPFRTFSDEDMQKIKKWERANWIQSAYARKEAFSVTQYYQEVLEEIEYEEHEKMWNVNEEMEERIDSGEIFGKSEKERKVDFATNEIIEKIKAAGIEVVTDKDEFDRILEQEERIQKMAVSISELEDLNNSIKNQKQDIKIEKELSNTLDKDEKVLNEFNLNKFAEKIKPYDKFFTNNTYIKLDDINYLKSPYKNFELYIGKNSTGHFVLSFTNENSITKEQSEHHDFYDIKNQRFQVYKTGTQFLFEEMNNVFEISKELFSKKDYIPEIQNELKNILEAIQSRNSDILENLIKNNQNRKEYLDNKVSEIKEFEKIEARKNVDNWLYEAEEKAEDLWNKDQDEVKAYYTNTDERKSIGIIPQTAMQIFDGVEDYHLYADKSYLIDHYLNRHHDNRLFENIQNVLDNYSNIYFDKQQNSIGFVKNYGTLADCLFVKEESGKVVLFASTYNQPEHRLHSDRYKKITPARKQELDMSLEGSTPLSQNPKGNTAVAISDVNDNSIIADTENKSTLQKMVTSANTYGFVYEGKIYLNPGLMNSNAAVHEYTHLWDAYTQKTNPELWNKGMNLFKNTKYWNEVISDPNYQDIKNDDNLVLSEIHSRICGDIAEKVLERIAELDGKQVKLDAIDWDKETWNYICEEMMQENKTINYSNGLNSFDLTEFLSTPMKDLIAENNILKTNSLEWTSVGNARDTDYTYYKNHSIERYFAGININNENTYSVKIDGVPLTFIDEETNEENELYFSEKELDKQILNDTLYYGKSMDEINFDSNNKTSSIISEPSISYMPKKDPAVTRDVINQAKARRASYCHSVVKGEKKGLWKSFNEFQRHGVFDIQGQTLMTDKNGHLTDTGFKQLAISMDIYRDKRFESARYVFVDKDGTIKDQMALSTFMPNHSISKLDETFKQVLEHAEKTNTKIAFVHNHPSGNIEASYDDIQFTKELESYLNQDNKDLFLGHVILDHDTFNCYSPESKWNSVTFEHPGKDRFEKEVPNFAKTVIDGDKKLREIAQSINSTNEYNKDWIPVIFARENASVGGVEYFNKDFFIENDSNAIKNEFEKIGLLCGSDRAIPLVPNGMSYEPELHSEMINKFREGCFYDMALGNRTTTDLHLTKYSNEIFNYTQKEMEEMTKIESTFEPVKVSKKEIGVSSKVAENKTYYVRENIQPVNVKTLLEKHENIPIFDHKYFVDQKFLPAFTFANNDVYVRCNAKNLAINSELKLNPEKKVDLILSKKQFAQIIATEKLKEKVARMHDFEVNNKAITPIVVAPNNMTALQQDLIFHQNNHLNYTERKEAFSSMYKEIMDNVKQIETKTLSINQKTILDINQEFNKMQKPNSINSVQKTPEQEYDNSVDFGI